MQKHFFSFIFLLLLLSAYSAFSQNDSLIFYPVNNSLLQQYDIRRISAAADGKLWLATGNGLLSYDGNDIQIFLPKEGDSTSLSGHSLSRIFIDKYGNLFAAIIADGQIDYFNTKTGKVERFKLKIEKEDSSQYSLSDPFIDILIDTDNKIWCGRMDMGFIYYNSITKKIQNYSLLSLSNKNSNSVNAIRKDPDNKNILWLGTQDGIYSFNKKTNQLNRNFKCSNLMDSMAGDINLSCMDIKRHDTIWFTSREGRGLGCYDVKTGRYTIFPFYSKKAEENPLEIFSMQYLDSNEYLFAFADRFPIIFNTKTKEYHLISRSGGDNPPQQNINQVLKDSLGNVWCLSYGKLYLAKSRKNNLQTIPIHDLYYKDRFTNAFKKVIWDEKRNVYYAAFHMSDGIFIFDKNVNLIKSISGPSYKSSTFGYIEAVVVDIGLDKYGRLWMTGDRLSLYDSLKQKMIPIIDYHPDLKSLNQRLRNLIFRNNYMYTLSTNWSSQYLYRLNLDNFAFDSIFLAHIPVAENQPANQLGPLEMDNKGELAYISNKNIVFQYNLKTGKTRKIIELIDIDKPYAHFSNFHWYNVDDNNNLWVSSLTKTWVFEPLNLKIIDSFEREKHTYFVQSSNLSGKGIMFFTNSTSHDLYDYRNQKHYKLSIKDGIVTYDNYGASCANNTLFIGYDNFMQYVPIASIINKVKNRKCYLSGIQIFNNPLLDDTLAEYLHILKLAHNQNYISFTFSTTEFNQPERLEYRYKLDGIDKDWIYVNYLNRSASYTNLIPGNYTFHASVKNDDGSWSNNDVNLPINIIPAWWQTNWFKITCIIAACALAFIFILWRINTVRKQEQQKAKTEKELLELEAKALRAQMNPHFIFNCLNSIKALMQEGETEKGVKYLTTFSKLIRTLFNNADKKEISLYDEIETCKFYLQLEAMRFDAAFNYTINTDPEIDLKSVNIPALIIQPFIENAIWHGIVPGGIGGNIRLDVGRNNGYVDIIVEDDGIGREVSRQNKSATRATHDSKGVSLTQSRLELDNLLKQRNAKFEIIDKKDEMGNALGTKVIIKIQEETE